MGNYGSGGANFTPDDVTLDLNSSQEAPVKPSAITQSSSLENVTYSSDTTLYADVYANDVTIDSGVTITTNGYNFYCAGNFTNNGTINTGNLTGPSTVGNNSSYTNGSAPSTSYSNSYGGSGGSGAASNSTGIIGGNGGNTLVNGGSAPSGGGSGAVGNAGSSNTAPTLTASLLTTWYNNGMSNYITGNSGGSGWSYDNTTTGGGGGYGIYIQANTITAGTINANGAEGTAAAYNFGSAGSGGGGCIVLAYGSGGYTAGTYNVNGGAANGNPAGGAGGKGLVLTYSGIPFGISRFSYTTNSQSIANRNSSYKYQSVSTTSTSSTTTVISQSLTPQTSGLIAVRVIAKIYNDTISDGINIYLYNGTDIIDNDTYTQEGLASNPHLTALYYEAQYTTGTSQTFSVQIEAVTGGTAYCEIQEFTIEEIY